MSLAFTLYSEIRVGIGSPSSQDFGGPGLVGVLVRYWECKILPCKWVDSVHPTMQSQTAYEPGCDSWTGLQFLCSHKAKKGGKLVRNEYEF